MKKRAEKRRKKRRREKKRHCLSCLIGKSAGHIKQWIYGDLCLHLHCNERQLKEFENFFNLPSCDGWLWRLSCSIHIQHLRSSEHLIQSPVSRKKFYHFFFLLWGWVNIGPGCLEMFWNLCPWTYSKLYQTWTTCSNWTSFKQGIGLDDLWRDLPTQIILWFCAADE